MRSTLLVMALLVPVLTGSADSATLQQAATGPVPKPEAAPKSQAQNASVLLQALAHAQNEEDARAIESQIATLWSRSGSASADLIFERANKAWEDDDIATARDLLKRLTSIAPSFAEGWHQRADAAVEDEDYQDAMASLKRTLELQPDHFGALSELGQILEDFGDKPRALAAYRKALTIDPYAEGVADRVRELSRDVEGQGI